MKILVTGAAGFIGYHLCESLIMDGHEVIGLDNINDYYDPKLKYSRLENLGINNDSKTFNKIIKSTIHHEKFCFIRLSLENFDDLKKVFKKYDFDLVCNLAAQAGVRYSLKNPHTYINSNIVGFLNIIECCKIFDIKRLVYASSSSVYGQNDNIPFSETESVDKPISLYAASKKSNELIAHSYSHLFNIETIGLRFFTVYGPWGRPDMALFLFTDALVKNKPIDVFNHGNLSRDFTYIDDIIEGVKNTLLLESKNKSDYKIYNIGNSRPVKLLDFILEIEKNLNKKAEKNMLPMQPGDVYKTFADTSNLEQDYNYKPNTTTEFGIKNFIIWYKKYYNING